MTDPRSIRASAFSDTELTIDVGGPVTLSTPIGTVAIGGMRFGRIEISETHVRIEAVDLQEEIVISDLPRDVRIYIQGEDRTDTVVVNSANKTP